MVRCFLNPRSEFWVSATLPRCPWAECLSPPQFVQCKLVCSQQLMRLNGSSLVWMCDIKSSRGSDYCRDLKVTVKMVYSPLFRENHMVRAALSNICIFNSTEFELIREVDGENMFLWPLTTAELLNIRREVAAHKELPPKCYANHFSVCQLIIIFGNFNVLANCHWSGQWLCLECWSERSTDPDFPQMVCRMIINRPMNTNSSTVSSCVQVSCSASTQQNMDNMQKPDMFLLSTGVSDCISAATESIVSETFKVISSAWTA